MDSKVPRHIALVLDGNRRYAKKLGLNPWKGHEFGLRKLEDFFKWCMEFGIKELTLYCFSTENFNRAKKEVSYLFELFWKEFKKIQERKGMYMDKIKINVIGRIHMFPQKMQKAMKEAIQKTKKNNELVINFAMAYGGRQEITDAVKKIAQNIKNGKIKIEDIDENLIAENLYLKNEPDLVIRPGGEKRISNFLIWQSSYAELFFIEKLWPEFTKKDLVKCIGEFNKRERRFGK